MVLRFSYKSSKALEGAHGQGKQNSLRLENQKHESDTKDCFQQVN